MEQLVKNRKLWFNINFESCLVYRKILPSFLLGINCHFYIGYLTKIKNHHKGTTMNLWQLDCAMYYPMCRFTLLLFLFIHCVDSLFLLFLFYPLCFPLSICWVKIRSKVCLLKKFQIYQLIKYYFYWF